MLTTRPRTLLHHMHLHTAYAGGGLSDQLYAGSIGISETGHAVRSTGNSLSEVSWSGPEIKSNASVRLLRRVAICWLLLHSFIWHNIFLAAACEGSVACHCATAYLASVSASAICIY